MVIFMVIFQNHRCLVPPPSWNFFYHKKKKSKSNSCITLWLLHPTLLLAALKSFMVSQVSLTSSQVLTLTGRVGAAANGDAAWGGDDAPAVGGGVQRIHLWAVFLMIRWVVPAAGHLPPTPHEHDSINAGGRVEVTENWRRTLKGGHWLRASLTCGLQEGQKLTTKKSPRDLVVIMHKLFLTWFSCFFSCLFFSLIANMNEQNNQLILIYLFHSKGKKNLNISDINKQQIKTRSIQFWPLV